MRTSLAIDRKTAQRRVVLAYEILFLFFSHGIVYSDVNERYYLVLCTLIIKQVLPKYSDSYIFNWHSKFANCLTWPKVNVLPHGWKALPQVAKLPDMNSHHYDLFCTLKEMKDGLWFRKWMLLWPEGPANSTLKASQEGFKDPQNTDTVWES